MCRDKKIPVGEKKMSEYGDPAFVDPDAVASEERREKILGSGSADSDVSTIRQRWSTEVGPTAVVWASIYLSLLALLLLLSFVILWPPPSVGGDRTAKPGVTILSFHFSPPDDLETHMLLLVATAGAMGGTTQALRMLSWSVAHLVLPKSWMLRMYVRPLIGILFAIVLFIFTRGGLLSPNSTIDNTNPFGFIAIGALVGLIGDEPIEKIRELASGLLSVTPPSKK
jgi:hypothetical protein